MNRSRGSTLVGGSSALAVFIGGGLGAFTTLTGTSALLAVVVAVAGVAQAFPTYFLYGGAVLFPWVELLSKFHLGHVSLAAPIDVGVAATSLLYTARFVIRALLSKLVSPAAVVAGMVLMVTTWAVASLSWSIDGTVAFHELTRVLSSLCVLVMIMGEVEARGIKLVHTLTRLAVASSVPVVAIGIFQWLARAGLRFNAGAVRVPSIFLYTNNYGYYLVPITLILLSYLLRFRGTLKTWQFVGGVIWTVALLVSAASTQSRTVWGALFVGVLLVLLAYRSYVWSVIFVLVGIGVLTLPSVQLRLHELYQALAFPTASLLNSVVWRFVAWRVSLADLTSPLAWMVGHGFGSANLAMLPVFNTLLGGPHNQLIEWVVDQGLVGVLFLAVLGVAIVLYGIRAMRTHGTSPIVLAMLAALVGYGLITLVDNPITYYDVNFYYSLIIGSSIGLLAHQGRLTKQGGKASR